MQVSGRDDGRGPDDADRGAPPRVPAWSTFGLFAETLFTGFLVAGFGLLLVTLLPATAAGTAHLRRYLRGDADSVGTFVADFRAAWRALWPLATGVPVLVGVLVGNAVLVGNGAVPGGRPMVAVMVVMAAILVVVSLRAAVMWRRGEAMSSRREAMSDAAQRSVNDPVGTTLIAVALGLCALLAWMLLPLVVIVPGLLAFALVAVELRRQRGAR